MESFISTFHIDWKIIIAQAINFVIILSVLYLFALKPLKKMMSERTSRIEKGIEDAKTNSEMLANTQKEYDTVLAKAKTEAHEIFQEGKREAEQKKAELLENASKEVEAMITNGKKILEAEKVKMVEEAKKEIVTLVVKATEKLLESEDNNSYEAKTIEKIKKM